jgi:hypothetical protein
MRPLFSLWSDYGTPARRRYVSAASRGNLLSVVRKVFLIAIIVAAAVIGVRELYGQAAEKRGFLEPGARPQGQLTPSATGRRAAGVAAIPLSPQPVLSMEHAATVSPAPADAPKPSFAAAPVVASAVSDDHAIPPALNAVPGALAKAAALPQPPATLAAVRPPATSVAVKPADVARSVAARKVVHAQLSRHDVRSLAVYAETIAARFGHGREFRAALQSFL